MVNRLLLSGTDWRLTGWNRNQWKLNRSMELGFAINPMLPTMSATVPGSVQADLMAAGWLPDSNESLRSLEMEWVNHRDWVFEKSFEVPEGWIKDRCELVFEGLDYAGQIYLNGVQVASFDGMFVPVSIEVTSFIRTGQGNANLLQILFEPSPEVEGQIGYSNEIRHLKSRFNYGWDWCPRIVPVGLWKDAYLITYSRFKVVDYYPEASLANEEKVGILRFRTEAETWRPGSYMFEYRVDDVGGSTVHLSEEKVVMSSGRRVVEKVVEVRDIELWWPNGYGEHPTYHALVSVYDGEGNLCYSAGKRIGFRSLSFMDNADAPPDALPYTLFVNGTRVFLKGVNWVPMTPFYGNASREEYEHRLGRFKEMNVNLLRVWGGAITEKEHFYDYCDRNGLLVWQEFLQSSSGLNNCPPDNAAFLAKLGEVSRIAIAEKRSHPSLAIWCGGNELMWEKLRPVDERHGNIAMLHELVAELDTGRLFLPTSASGPRFNASEEEFGKGVHHDVHGPWLYLGEERHYRFFNGNDSLLQSEAGTPGASRVELLRKWAGSLSPWPPTKHNAYWLHRGAWWIQWNELNTLFGQWEENRDEIDLYCQASRYLQMESLRYMAEATRRREPRSSGFIVWMGNEPFSNNANTSVIEYDGMPKPAYYALKKAFGALHVSAKYDRLTYAPGQRFRTEVFLHEEGEGLAREAHTVTADLLGVDGVAILRRSFTLEAGDRKSEYTGIVEWDVERVPKGAFLLRLRVQDNRGELIAFNDYAFTVDSACPLEPLRRLPIVDVHVEAGSHPRQIELSNLSPVAAIGVFLIQKNPLELIHLDFNFVTLLPGEKVTVTSPNRTILPDDFYLEGINIGVGD